MGLDEDGRLYVEIDCGIRLSDLCWDTPLPRAMAVSPEYLMRPENRQLYYRFLATLNEIDAIVYQSVYDRGCKFHSGDIVVDAGARVGTFAAKVSRLVGEEGRVIAVEPEPQNHACLLKNIRLNRLHNVIPVKKMLWSRTVSLNLYLSRYFAAHSAFDDSFYNPTGDTIIVEGDSLDNIMKAVGVRRVDFIKMDIEGSEIEALEGMESILASEVQMAIAAYHPVAGIPTHRAIIPRLESLGFHTHYTSEGIVQASRKKAFG